MSTQEILKLKEQIPQIYQESTSVFGDAWSIKKYGDNYIVRTTFGLFCLDATLQKTVWAVKVNDKMFMTYNGFEIFDDVVVYMYNDAATNCYHVVGVNADDGSEVWQMQLHPGDVMAGLLKLSGRAVVFDCEDWRGTGKTDLLEIDPKTGKTLHRAEAIKLRPTSRAPEIGGGVMAVVSSEYAYFVQKDEGLYRYKSGDAKIELMAEGMFKQLQSNGDLTVAYLWEDKQGKLMLVDKGGVVEGTKPIQLSGNEEIESISLAKHGSEVHIYLTLEHEQGVGMYDWQKGDWAWKYSDDGATRFSYTQHTPAGLICRAHIKATLKKEIWIFDTKSGDILQKIAPKSATSWNGWLDGELLITTNYGLDVYGLS